MATRSKSSQRLASYRAVHPNRPIESSKSTLMDSSSQATVILDNYWGKYEPRCEIKIEKTRHIYIIDIDSQDETPINVKTIDEKSPAEVFKKLAS